MTQSIDIPCQKCVECRLNRSRDWANRLMMEGMYYESKYFLTLTYRDVDCPRNSEGFMTLRSKELQDFMKRLRWHSDKEIRFFACGEYGSQTFRPHYHVVVFGLEIPDLEFYSVSNGNPLYTSKWLEKIWNRGYVVIGSVDWQSCAYTARYCMKKVFGDKTEYYDEYDLEPEFLRMSRRPGIAHQYFEDHGKKIYETDEIILKGKDKGIRSKPPRYFDKLLENVNPAVYECIKQRRKMIQENLKKQMLLQTHLTYDKILENRGYNIEQRIKALKRSL